MSYMEKIEEEQKAREDSVILKGIKNLKLGLAIFATLATPAVLVSIHNAPEEERALLKPTFVAEQEADEELLNNEIVVTTTYGEKVKVR